MKIFIVLLLSALTALSQVRPPGPPVTTNLLDCYYKAGEFNVDLFGAYSTTDFSDERGLLGVGVNLFMTRNWGIGATVNASSLNGTFIDEAGGHLIYRIPIGKSALHFRAGAAHRIESETWNLQLGPELEHRLTRNVGGFVGAYIDKSIDLGDVGAVGRAGVRLSW